MAACWGRPGAHELKIGAPTAAAGGTRDSKTPTRLLQVAGAWAEHPGSGAAQQPREARGTTEVPPRLPGVVWAPDPVSWSPLPSTPTAAAFVNRTFVRDGHNPQVVSSILAPPSLREVQGRPRPPTVASARRPPRTGTRPPRTPGGPTWLALGWHGSGGCQWL